MCIRVLQRRRLAAQQGAQRNAVALRGIRVLHTRHVEPVRRGGRQGRVRQAGVDEAGRLTRGCLPQPCIHWLVFPSAHGTGWGLGPNYAAAGVRQQHVLDIPAHSVSSHQVGARSTLPTRCGSTCVKTFQNTPPPYSRSSPGGGQVNVAHQVWQHEAARHPRAAREEGQPDVCRGMVGEAAGIGAAGCGQQAR